MIVINNDNVNYDDDDDDVFNVELKFVLNVMSRMPSCWRRDLRQEWTSSAWCCTLGMFLGVGRSLGALQVLLCPSNHQLRVRYYD